MSKESTANNSVGFGGLLTIALIVLKLTGHFPYSWWWVFGAFWIPLAFVGILLLIALIVSLMPDFS